MFLLKGILGGNTPRKVYASTYKMDSFAWATTWPPVCLLVCITVVYSVIQPVITVLALVAFVMLYAAYKYTLYWCADQPDSLETGGLFYIKAIRTIFVSLYLEGVCLAGLFFLSTDASGGRAPSGLACGALMIVMIVGIAILQTYIDHFKYRRDYLVYAQTTAGVARTPAFVPKALASPKVGSGAAEPKLGLHQAPTTASDEDEAAGPELGNTSGFHARAFHHPALWKKQPAIWIADDTLGLGKFQAERLNGLDVEASTEFASMDEKGNVVVERGPPDEAWYGGFSAQ